MRIGIIAHKVDTQTLLSVPGIDVVAETSGTESLEEHASTLCDSILVDIDNCQAHEFQEIARLFPTVCMVGLVSRDTNAFLVIEAKNCGCVEFVPKPFEPEKLAEVLGKVGGQGQTRGKIISVIGASGGAGATTVACNLAVALMDKGKVGLIDADLTFGGVGAYFDLTVDHTIADVCDCDQIDVVTLQAAMLKTPSGIMVLNNPKNIAERLKVTPSKMAAIIHSASSKFHYTVIDLPRQLDDFVGHVMLRSTRVLIVTETNVGSVKNARTIRSALIEEGMSEGSIAIVLNRSAKKTAHAVTEAHVRQTAGPVCVTIPNDFPAALQASDHGVPIAASSPIWKAIRQLAAQIAGDDTEVTQTKSKFMKLLTGGKC